MMRNLIPWRKKFQSAAPSFGTDTGTETDRFLNTLLFSPYDRLQKGRLLPSINIINKDKTIVVEAEVPGVKPKDIDLYLSGRRLSIKAERKDEKKEERKDFHRMEISYGSYSRMVELPADVEQSPVDARYKNGVLNIELKKTKSSQKKVIKIK